MTRVNGPESVAALATLIRRQVASLAKPLANALPNTQGDIARPSRQRPAKKDDLASIVARRVRAIDPSNPDAEREAFRIFLEAVLLGEFGEHLANDPAFHVLVDQVMQEMGSSADAARMMRQAAGALLQKRG